jgi:MOSC domain-containing protein YiiM
MTVLGRVLSLHIATTAAASMGTLEQVHAVAGRGLESDRYFSGFGTFSKFPGAGRHLTLIEGEALDALRREHGIDLAPAQARRNVVTQGVSLNFLVGQEFSIGAVRLRGIRRCDPCAHLEKLTIPGVRRGLMERGGLRADIVVTGMIRVADLIQPVAHR